jgi:prepilin-type N-terminal cleavage/methylation domain-containing protein
MKLEAHHRAARTKAHPSGRRKPSRVRAFTLIELVISAALMAMILSAAYACFSAALAGRRTIEARADMLQSGRVALARIAADLRSACPLSSRFEFLGMDRQIGDVEADNLDFATRNLSLPHSGPPADWCEVSYFLGRDPVAEDWVLYRRRDWTPDEQPVAGGSREEIARGLKGVRFEYYDGWDWYDEWGDPEGRRAQQDSWLLPANLEGMPDAVRITLWFDTDESPGQQSSRARSEAPPPPLTMQTVAYLALARAPLPQDSASDSPQEPSAGPQTAGAEPSPGGRP